MAGPLALSPELNVRLMKEFPPGSPASRLNKELVREGFRLDAPCDEDKSIHTASYLQEHYVLYQLQSSVYWKFDRQNKLIWTMGFV